VADTLAAIIGIPLTSLAAEQATLRLASFHQNGRIVERHYGLGLSPTAVLCDAQFAQAYHDFEMRRAADPSASKVSDLLPSLFKSAVLDAISLRQQYSALKTHDLAAAFKPKSLVAIVERKRELLFEAKVASEDRNKARLNSISGPGASYFLRAIPSHPELSISPMNFAITLSCFLGLNFPFKTPGLCVCGHPIDAEGIHLRCCSFIGGIPPHDTICHCLRDMAMQAGHYVQPAAASTFIHRDCVENPTDELLDLMIHPLLTSNTKVYGVDVSIRNPSAQSVLRSPGEAAHIGEQEKRKKHQAACDASLCVDFVPFVIEFFGTFGPTAWWFFNALVAELPARAFIPCNSSVTSWKSYWLQVFSVTLAKQESERVLDLVRESAHHELGVAHL
jgi:hypothetical protein